MEFYDVEIVIGEDKDDKITKKNAYGIFSKEVREEEKNSQVKSSIPQKWKALSEEEKKEYASKAEEINKKNGFVASTKRKAKEIEKTSSTKKGTEKSEDNKTSHNKTHSPKVQKKSTPTPQASSDKQESTSTNQDKNKDPIKIKQEKGIEEQKPSTEDVKNNSESLEIPN